VSKGGDAFGMGKTLFCDTVGGTRIEVGKGSRYAVRWVTADGE